MKPFTVHKGIVAPLDSANVDTDQIIPKQFLKLIEKTGFGKFLFFDWRFKGENALNPEFEMNAPRYQGASILLTRDNFGCGSSREHAPWAIDDYGFRAILAPSFADIFHNNCFNNGLLPIRLDAALIQKLFDETRRTPGYQLTIDLEKETVTTPSGESIAFKIDPFKKHCLLGGLDQIGLTLQHEAKIAEYERKNG